MLENIDPAVRVAVGVASLCGVIGAWVKWLRPKARQAEAVGEAILGRPEVRDRSGAVIQSAQPGMVAQVAVLTETVQKLADVHRRMDHLEGEHTNLKGRVSVLEDSRVERVVSQVESTSAYRAMEAIAKAQPED